MECGLGMRLVGSGCGLGNEASREWVWRASVNWG